MARRRSPVEVELQPAKGELVPTPEELDNILRAADEIVGLAGRALAAKILKGSKEKRVLALDFTECPAYGSLKKYTLEQITQKIDWTIAKGYLEIEYNGRLPVLAFSGWGFDHYIPIYGQEIHQRILAAASQPDTWDTVIEHLRSTNRRVVFWALDTIAASCNIGVVRFLEAWQETEVRKVQTKINVTVNAIRRGR